MFLPPTPPESQQGQRDITALVARISNTQVKPSRKYRFAITLARWSIYGELFGLGVGAANFARLFPHGWVAYLALMTSAAGWLMFVKPADASPDAVSLRRIGGLAMSVSIIALWDAVIIVANLPVQIGFWVFPAWLVCSIAFALLIGSYMTLTGASQRR